MARQKKESSASNPYLLHHSILLLNNPTILGSKSKDSERISKSPGHGATHTTININILLHYYTEADTW